MVFSWVKRSSSECDVVFVYKTTTTEDITFLPTPSLLDALLFVDFVFFVAELLSRHGYGAVRFRRAVDQHGVTAVVNHVGGCAENFGRQHANTGDAFFQ